MYNFFLGTVLHMRKTDPLISFNIHFINSTIIFKTISSIGSAWEIKIKNYLKNLILYF